MTMVMISPSRREVSPAEQLCRSPRLVPPRFQEGSHSQQCVFRTYSYTFSSGRSFHKESPQPKSATDLTEVKIPSMVDLVMEVLVITPDWTVPYIAYILRKELPEDEEEARQIV